MSVFVCLSLPFISLWLSSFPPSFVSSLYSSLCVFICSIYIYIYPCIDTYIIYIIYILHIYIYICILCVCTVRLTRKELEGGVRLFNSKSLLLSSKEGGLFTALRRGDEFGVSSLSIINPSEGEAVAAVLTDKAGINSIAFALCFFVALLLTLL